jgi:hypothetical protein
MERHAQTGAREDSQWVSTGAASWGWVLAGFAAWHANGRSGPAPGVLGDWGEKWPVTDRWAKRRGTSLALVGWIRFTGLTR